MKNLVKPDLSGKRAVVLGDGCGFGSKIFKSLTSTITVVTDFWALLIISVKTAFCQSGLSFSQAIHYLIAQGINLFNLINFFLAVACQAIQNKLTYLYCNKIPDL